MITQVVHSFHSLSSPSFFMSSLWLCLCVSFNVGVPLDLMVDLCLSSLFLSLSLSLSLSIFISLIYCLSSFFLKLFSFFLPPSCFLYFFLLSFFRSDILSPPTHSTSYLFKVRVPIWSSCIFFFNARVSSLSLPLFPANIVFFSLSSPGVVFFLLFSIYFFLLLLLSVFTLVFYLYTQGTQQTNPNSVEMNIFLLCSVSFDVCFLYLSLSFYLFLYYFDCEYYLVKVSKCKWSKLSLSLSLSR